MPPVISYSNNLHTTVHRALTQYGPRGGETDAPRYTCVPCRKKALRLSLRPTTWHCLFCRGLCGLDMAQLFYVLPPEVSKVSKVNSVGPYSSLASTSLFTATGNSHAIWDHTVWPATREM